jgi:flagella basal body P-ring formation protein FlgA
MLRTGGEVRFKQRPIEGVTAAGNAERLILDGQQRLTSLFQALKLGQPIETQDARKRRVSVSHAANPAFMLKDDFDGFIADRRRRLLRMISDAMGKRADETLGESVIEPAEADEDLHDA